MRVEKTLKIANLIYSEILWHDVFKNCMNTKIVLHLHCYIQKQSTASIRSTKSNRGRKKAFQRNKVIHIISSFIHCLPFVLLRWKISKNKKKKKEITEIIPIILRKQIELLLSPKKFASQ